MVATAFDALSDTELALEELQAEATETGNARVRMGTLRAIVLRLTTMRRQLGPQRGIFERIGEEIGQVECLSTDNERYFERVYEQLNRVVDGIDAAADSMAQLMDLRMNETMYWLTVVATIFLPLTFLTGFFGMNFGWMVGRIESEAAFLRWGSADRPWRRRDLDRDQAPRRPPWSPIRMRSRNSSPPCAARWAEQRRRRPAALKRSAPLPIHAFHAQGTSHMPGDRRRDRARSRRRRPGAAAAPAGRADAGRAGDRASLRPALGEGDDRRRQPHPPPALHWGGGHRHWNSRGYDCSGSVSYVLHAGGLLDWALDSTGFMRWGGGGAGLLGADLRKSEHVYAVIAGLRWDTSMTDDGDRRGRAGAK